ncbi:hypothetical protein P7C70_g1142, partial [Phenoliferia sp. Uapishka_3]
MIPNLNWLRPRIVLPSTPSFRHSFSSQPNSRPTSPDYLAEFEDKLGGQSRSPSSSRWAGGAAGGGGPRSLLQTLWLWLSPIVTIVLLMALGMKKATLEDKGVMDPYLCRPPSMFKSLDSVCSSADASRPQETIFQEEVGKFVVDTDLSLRSAQCDAIFPGLYLEADRSRDYWLSRGGVNSSDLDAAEQQGQARAMIKNNRLYIKSYSDNQQGTRTKATLAAINEAITTSLEPLPDVEFVIQTGDTGIVAGAPWALGREEDQEDLTLIPDYGFFSWPEPGVGSFLEIQDKTLLYEAKQSWQDKIAKLFWKGALMVDVRKELITIAEEFPWGAVTDIDWSDKQRVQEELLTQEDHCKYKYLAHAEGWAYSGRLKYLLQCRSVVIAHKMQYLQHFHHLFNSDPTSPQQNLVISPGRNFDRLPEVMEALQRDDKRAEMIATNSFNFYRHWLSPASVNCYWRRLITRWAEVQNFDPVLHKNDASYNSFILLGRVHWIPY